MCFSLEEDAVFISGPIMAYFECGLCINEKKRCLHSRIRICRFCFEPHPTQGLVMISTCYASVLKSFIRTSLIVVFAFVVPVLSRNN